MEHEAGSWEDCPPGLVTEMAARLRRRRQFVRTGTVILGMVLLLVMGAGYVAMLSPRPKFPAALDCAETVSLFARYHEHELDAEEERRVTEHLSNCRKCREHYERQFPSEVRAGTGKARLLGVLAP